LETKTFFCLFTLVQDDHQRLTKVPYMQLDICGSLHSDKILPLALKFHYFGTKIQLNISLITMGVRRGGQEGALDPPGRPK